MIVQHNMASANAARQLAINDKMKARHMWKLSTGYRINVAADDAAGLAISEKLRSQVRGLNRAAKNCDEGISLLKTADGALQEVHNMLQRMNELCVQAANDAVYTEDDRFQIQAEIDALKQEINRVGTDTEFNTIPIFKPTNLPGITGTPTDILIFYEDEGTGTRAGGIVYKGVRYTYEEMDLVYDSSGNIQAGTYEVRVKGQTGTWVNINLIFSGGNRVPSGREYILMPDERGITIDDILHPWSEIKDEHGVPLDTSYVRAGKYSFRHAGLTIDFEVEADSDLDSLISQLSRTSMTNFKLKSVKMNPVQQAVNPGIVMTNSYTVIRNGSGVTQQMYIPNDPAHNNICHYYMEATDTGMRMYLDGADNLQNPGQRVNFDFMSWEDLDIYPNDFMVTPEANPDNNDGHNPGSSYDTEHYKSHTYHDSITNTDITFTIDSEASFSQLKSSIASWIIQVEPDNEMIFVPTDTSITSYPSHPTETDKTETISGITAGNHASILDSYGEQYRMGRNMDERMWLSAEAGNAITNTNNTSLSYTITDRNGTVYTMSAPNAYTVVKNAIRNVFESYRESYRSRLINRMEANYASITDASQDHFQTGGSVDIRFTATNNSEYWSDLETNVTIKNWLKDGNYTRTRTPVYDRNPNSPTYNQIIDYNYSAVYKGDAQAGVEAKIDDLAKKVLQKFGNSKIKVSTNDAVHTTNTPKAPATIPNERYTSNRDVWGRGLYIQTGANTQQAIKIDTPGLDCMTLGVGVLSVASHESAGEGIDSVASALAWVSDWRSYFGAIHNQLSHTFDLDNNGEENAQRAESLLRDADMADEMVSFSKYSILSQAGESILAQTEEYPQRVLQLLS